MRRLQLVSVPLDSADTHTYTYVQPRVQQSGDKSRLVKRGRLTVSREKCLSASLAIGLFYARCG